MTLTIDTTLPTNITATSFQCGGYNLLSLLPIIEKGVVYSYINLVPTLNNTNIINSDMGVGSFKITIANLLPSTTYYVRSYAINEKGEIAYGNIRSVRTLMSVTGNCSIPVTILPSQQYSLPAGYTLIGSDNNKSLASSCIDVTKLTDFTKQCYVVEFQTTPNNNRGNGKRIYDTISILGFVINDIDYMFTNSPVTNISVVSGYSNDDFYTAINNTNYLKDIITPSNWYNFADSTNGGPLVFSFKAFFVDSKNVFCKFSATGSNADGSQIIFSPIETIVDYNNRTGKNLSC